VTVEKGDKLLLVHHVPVNMVKNGVLLILHYIVKIFLTCYAKIDLDYNDDFSPYNHLSEKGKIKSRRSTDLITKKEFKTYVFIIPIFLSVQFKSKKKYPDYNNNFNFSGRNLANNEILMSNSAIKKTWCPLNKL